MTFESHSHFSLRLTFWNSFGIGLKNTQKNMQELCTLRKSYAQNMQKICKIYRPDVQIMQKNMQKNMQFM